MYLYSLQIKGDSQKKKNDTDLGVLGISWKLLCEDSELNPFFFHMWRMVRTEVTAACKDETDI
jgi:hypothetical protein